MEPSKILKVGSQYSKNDLASLLDQPLLTTVRDGVYSCKFTAVKFPILFAVC